MVNARKVLDLIESRNKKSEDAVNERAPEVGIFWMYKGELLGQHSEPLVTAYDDGMFVNANIDHYNFWRTLQRTPVIPNELRGVDYEKVPRGRVIYNKEDDVYNVFGPRLEINDPIWQQKIRRAYSLPRGKVNFMPDSHYENPRMIR